jgi:hypothetical protein
MSTPRLRPTFDLEVPVDPKALMELVRARIDDGPRTARCTSRGSCAELFPDESERRLWSPYLSVQAEPAEGGGTRLHGRFAPFPEVWTFFMFVYGIAWFLITFGATLAYVQAASGEAASGLWGLWIGVPLVIALHTASAIGQRLGQTQMQALRARLERLVSVEP